MSKFQKSWPTGLLQYTEDQNENPKNQDLLLCACYNCPESGSSPFILIEGTNTAVECIPEWLL